ncbi:hypothetical protein D3C78_1569260 [compost metagenome]
MVGRFAYDVRRRHAASEMPKVHIRSITGEYSGVGASGIGSTIVSAGGVGSAWVVNIWVPAISITAFIVADAVASATTRATERM